jgi:hypothetical protein
MNSKGGKWHSYTRLSAHKWDTPPNSSLHRTLHNASTVATLAHFLIFLSPITWSQGKMTWTAKHQIYMTHALGTLICMGAISNCHKIKYYLENGRRICYPYYYKFQDSLVRCAIWKESKIRAKLDHWSTIKHTTRIINELCTTYQFDNYNNWRHRLWR